MPAYHAEGPGFHLPKRRMGEREEEAGKERGTPFARHQRTLIRTKQHSSKQQQGKHPGDGQCPDVQQSDQTAGIGL